MVARNESGAEVVNTGHYASLLGFCYPLPYAK